MASFLLPVDVIVTCSATSAATLLCSAVETKVVSTIDAPTGCEYSDVACSPGGSSAVFSSNQGVSVLAFPHKGPHTKAAGPTLCAKRGHSSNILSIDSTPDGVYIVTGGSDAAVVMWQRDDESGGYSPFRFLLEHTEWVRFVKFQYHALRKLCLYSASDDGSVIVWNPLARSPCIYKHANDTREGRFAIVRCFEAAREFNVVAVSYDIRRIVLFSLHSSSYQTSRSPSIHSRRSSISSHDGGGMITAAATSPTSVADSASTPDDQSTFVEVGEIIDAHRGVVVSMKFTLLADYLISAGEDELITVSCTKTGLPMWRNSTLTSRRRCVSFMNTISGITVMAAPPASSVIILCACASDGDVLLWVVDPRDGRCSYERKTQLTIGGLCGVSVLAREPAGREPGFW